MLFNSNDASISRTNSLFGTGCRTEIVIGMAFADRLLSFINTLPVSCSYCIKIGSILELIAWKELRASSAVDGFVAGVPAGCLASRDRETDYPGEQQNREKARIHEFIAVASLSSLATMHSCN